jgi:hypothetical protein
MTIEKSAKGVRGCLLYDCFSDSYFFRIYLEENTSGHKKFIDYDLCAQEIWLQIESGDLSFYEGKNRDILDWSSKTLGHTRNPGDPAARCVVQDGEVILKEVTDKDGKMRKWPVIEHGIYGEDMEFIPN